MTSERVRDIKERRKNGTIEIRVLKKWICKGIKEELCYQFVDAYGDAIEATGDMKHIEHFDSVIKLESCYRLSGYIATGARTYKATVDHPASLVIGQKTRFDPATELNLPTVYFKFATYDMLKTRMKDPRLLTDYIGRVQANSLRPTRKGQILRKIILLDETKSEVELTLWPEKNHLIGNNVIAGDIVAVTSTMVTEHNGNLQLESTSLTNAFINPEIPQIIDHVNRLRALPIVNTTSRSEPMTTIADLKLRTQHNTQMSTNFTCKATIKHIHEDRVWYYVLCSKCSKNLYPEEDNNQFTFVCEDDENITPNFRYCVNATIEDTTGTIDTIFFNESMEAIVNISCKDMFTKHAEKRNPKIVPTVLKSVKGTTKLLHLTLKNDGQIAVNSVSEVPSTTEPQSSGSTAGTTTFSPTTPAPKVGVSKRTATQKPGTDKKMKQV